MFLEAAHYDILISMPSAGPNGSMVITFILFITFLPPKIMLVFVEVILLLAVLLISSGEAFKSYLTEFNLYCT